MKSVDSNICSPSTAKISFWNVVVLDDFGVKTGLASTLSAAHDIALSFLDESRSSFLAWCGYHDRLADKEAFFDFIDICKSDFEQVHIELIDIPLPDMLAGAVCATNVVDFKMASQSDENPFQSKAPITHLHSPQVNSSPNVIVFRALRDPNELRLERAIKMLSEGSCSEPECKEAFQTIIDLALTNREMPVGRRAAEWASLWLYG